MSMISDLVERLRTEAKSMGTYGTDYMATLLTRSADTIEMLSEKAREPKRGEWIDAEIRHEDGVLPIQVCSECKAFYPLEYTGGGHRFCPNCGARMFAKDTNVPNKKGADDE